MLTPGRDEFSPSVFPTRRAYAALALVVIAFALYVSLLPFRLRPVPLDIAWDHFRMAMASWPRRLARANFLANILLFVPVGFGLCGALLADRPRRRLFRALVVVLPSSIAVSLAAEFLQEFAPGRVVAASDVLAQTVGCVVGIGAWAVAGPALTHWIRESSRRTHDDRLTRALVAYAALWVFVNLAPFDITLDVDRLGRRVRDGSITLVPFGSGLPIQRLLWDTVVTAVSAVPLGVLSLVGWQDRARRRPAGVACGIGVAAVFALESAQIFIRSHAADITDVICGAIGIAGGVWLGVWVFGRDRTLTDDERGLFAGWAWVALGAWCLMLCAYHWQPFDFRIDEALIRQKLARVSLIPFAAYRSGSDLNALNTLLAKLGMSVPFGMIASFALRPLTRRPALAVIAWAIVSGVVFAVIELGQFFLPTRVPDPSDVFLGIAASLLGLWAGRWLHSGYGVK